MRSVKNNLAVGKMAALLLSLICLPIRAQFTSGYVTVLQAGDGISSLANTGNPIILKEYPQNGGSVSYSMTVPFASLTSGLVISGSASSEGFLSLSADKKYLVFGGYAAALPNTIALPGATASSINRGIGMVGAQGAASYSRVATSTSFFTGNNIRGAAATSSSDFWGSGASQGTNYFGSSTPVTVQNSKQNLRAIAVFNGQLYCSSQVATGTPTDIGIYAIGNGTPTTNGQLVTTVINTGTGSQPAQFYFNVAGNICYIADQRNSAGGGIQKWVQSAGAWSLAYTLPTGTTAAGATGVVADFTSGGSPKVLATTNESSTNRLIAIQDLGAASTATTLATAPANTVFRGLAFSPCTPPVATALNSSISLCPGPATLNFSEAGSPPISTAFGGGVFSGSGGNTVVTFTASAIYTITASNACGSSPATWSVNVYPPPAVTVNSAVICPGYTATLTASGTNNYLWGNGSNSPSLAVTPAATTIYSVTGIETVNYCATTITTQVVVTNSPVMTVTSATACEGQSLALNASGADTYSWSTGASGSSVIVSPSVTTTYSVSGYVPGCPVSSGTATASVKPSPSLTVQADPGYLCTNFASTSTLSAGGASTYSWLPGINASTLVISQPGTYSVAGTGTNGCEATAILAIQGSICEGIADRIASQEITLSPNPASEYLKIVLSNPQEATLEVINSLGQPVYTSAVKEQELNIDLSGFPKGIYVIRLSTEHQKLSKKLLIN